jgi:diguanylate cyclase (GGDEF)-like protein
VIVSLHNALDALCLAVAAGSAGWLVRTVPSRHAVRLSSSFVVAASIGLPTPFGVLVALGAQGASRGAGLAGSSAPGWRALSAGLCGALVAQASGVALRGLPPIGSAAIVYLAMTGTVLAVESLFGAPRIDPVRAACELANIPAAAILCVPMKAGDAATFLSASILIVLAAIALNRLERARAARAADHGALALRHSELATLHAIGRDILATADPERMFAIIERECRKILDVELFFIGVFDRDTNEIRISYRSANDEVPQRTVRPMGDGLASWIVREKRPLRIDDTASGADGVPFRPYIVNESVRSLLAAPLLVGERVLGVVSVQSRRPGAYDDHQLFVLATIAQQAAVAVENARNQKAATIDSLTELPLRDGFFRRFEEEHVRARRYAGAFSILMLDLDGFKEINDRHGHLAGDRYLRALGAAIKVRLRGADIACRYGGDEFCLLLPETDLAGARPIAERLRHALSDLVVDVEGASVRTTVSIGIASYPEHDAGGIKSLLLHADSALYQAKRAGRDRVIAFAP